MVASFDAPELPPVPPEAPLVEEAPPPEEAEAPEDVEPEPPPSIELTVPELELAPDEAPEDVAPEDEAPDVPLEDAPEVVPELAPPVVPLLEAAIPASPVEPEEVPPLPPSVGSNARPVSKHPRSGAFPAYGSPTFVPLSMRGLFAARRRKGSTGRLPSACRALAIPPKVVMSVGETQGVPPGV